MNLAMRELRNGFLFEGTTASAGHSEQVYLPTTSTIINPSNSSKIVPFVTEVKSTQTLNEQPPAKKPDIFHSSGSDLSKSSKETVDIYFENIHYTVSLGFRKGMKEILHGVTGRFLPGQLIAIMGPSGAGKSTLLDVLSGYRISGVEGAVYVNGRGRNLDRFKKMSCYIMQDDRLQPLLTVQENMRVAADLKLSEELDQYDKDDTIERILTTLGLYEHKDTRASRLSGGQRKRLSIALELVNNPLVMFLDEPTTGLDSASCRQCVSLLKLLAKEGKTIICTIHQPSATLFQMFDQVYVLAQGSCLYQGSTNNIVPYLESVNMPCPKYHNPADFVIEIASGEHGEDKMKAMIDGMENGKCLSWFENPSDVCDLRTLRSRNPIAKMTRYRKTGLEETSETNQLKVLLKRGFLKARRDSTLTHLRIIVNIATGIMLGLLFINSGNEGSRVLDNYNLLFAILIHLMMTTKMLTILTFPMEMNILLKEHFNRWFSLPSYYLSITIVDIPIAIFCCFLFSVIIYTMSGQPLELFRFGMFFTISLLVVFVAQGFGLMIGAVFDVVNGTFLGPTISVPVMMFAGFGVTLRDLPKYLYWGSYVSYLRYGLEGFVGAIYGENRPILDCEERYCHYKYPQKFLSEIAMRGDQFWTDVIALSVIAVGLRIVAFFLLRWKITSVR
ncbi:ATP-binding cassette sub-family G member 4 [Arctopsyche grandis]|uniref:ATP-binding cassette sub-family G member 4 n=1 Tax=Arctopsyche grandis TaxID=121162 RepID=UPI00406D6F81